MGVQLKNIPVKLDEETIARIDEDVRRFAPFCAGRSAMLRALVHVAYGQIDAGKVKLTLAGIQRAIAARHVRGGHALKEGRPNVGKGPLLPLNQSLKNLAWNKPFSTPVTFDRPYGLYLAP